MSDCTHPTMSDFIAVVAVVDGKEIHVLDLLMSSAKEGCISTIGDKKCDTFAFKKISLAMDTTKS